MQTHTLPALAGEHARQLRSEARAAHRARRAARARRASARPAYVPIVSPIRNRAGWALVAVGLRLAGDSGGS